ncbi:hypothetical protein RIF29_16897 [Crotalaria pallida]|uniref:Uncharacterized protein n=1 Tax=Crotalaria pallida TaxID=3830 RepID=A0AAN9FLY1_CROPI
MNPQQSLIHTIQTKNQNPNNCLLSSLNFVCVPTKTISKFNFISLVTNTTFPLFYYYCYHHYTKRSIQS